MSDLSPVEFYNEICDEEHFAGVLDSFALNIYAGTRASVGEGLAEQLLEKNINTARKIYYLYENDRASQFLKYFCKYILRPYERMVEVPLFPEQIGVDPYPSMYMKREIYSERVGAEDKIDKFIKYVKERYGKT